MHKKSGSSVLLLIFMILLLTGYLLFCPQTAVRSAREGLLLWYHSVLPVVFPFMFLGTLGVRTISTEHLPEPMTRPFTALFGCSAYGAFVILAGFLCGFPMGAKLTGDLYRDSKISREEALFLLGFTNNLSPGFILSYLAVEQMQLPGQAGWFLVQILGASLLKGHLDGYGRKCRTSRKSDISQAGTTHPGRTVPVTCALIDDCINDAMGSALRLGAYILLFAILSGAVTQVVPLTNPAALICVSCLEVSNGIRLLAESSLSKSAKYIAVSALAAFGGLSALAQSAGIARMDREMLLYYVKSRVKLTLLAILLSAAVLHLCTGCAGIC